MSFYVGQKVVCVHDLVAPATVNELPRKGSIYTVRWVGRRPETDGDKVGVLLAEISAGIEPVSGNEYAFLAEHFRPLIERKTDISIFQRMLLPSEIKKAKELT